jgi:hypothetical protein
MLTTGYTDREGLHVSSRKRIKRGFFNYQEQNLNSGSHLTGATTKNRPTPLASDVVQLRALLYLTQIGKMVTPGTCLTEMMEAKTEGHGQAIGARHVREEARLPSLLAHRYSIRRRGGRGTLDVLGGGAAALGLMEAEVYKDGVTGAHEVDGEQRRRGQSRSSMVADGSREGG